VIYDQLYRQLEKEQGQLQIELFQKRKRSTVAATVVTVTIDLGRKDSIFIVSHLCVTADPHPTAAVIGTQCYYALDNLAEFITLWDEGLILQSPQNIDGKSVFPTNTILPGGAVLSGTSNFSSGTSDNICDFSVTGIFIPRGQVSIQF